MATKRSDHPVTRALLSWYHRERRDLPWRRQPGPYRVWLSEVMLQQTRVETALPYYRRFLKRFPSLRDLARASEEEVLSLWSGLGYYRRARSLLAGAREVVDRFGGEFPTSLADALSIPGVGPYTAAAVLSIAYGFRHPVVDGNVERVVTRLLRIPGNPKQAGISRRLRDVVAEWLPPENPGDLNQALMDLGATVCTPSRPQCRRCPLEASCLARRDGDAERFPERPPPRRSESVRLEVGLLRNRGRYLLERPAAFGFLRDLWVFPLAVARSGRLGEGGEVASTLASKLGVPVRVTGELASLRHAITYRRITLFPKLLEARGVDLRGRDGFRWARLSQLADEVPVSSICLKIARRL